MNDREAIAAYLTWLRDTRRRSPLTLAKYGEVLGKYLEHLAGTPMRAASEADIEAFALRPRRGGRLPADATAATDVNILAAFYSWAQARMDWRNPATTAGKPKVRNAHPRPVPADAWATLWASALPPDARLALGLGYYCGFRREEIVSLCGRHVDLAGRMFRGFPRKGGGDDVFDYGDVLDHTARRLPQAGDVRLFEEALAFAVVTRDPDDRLLSWPSVRPQAVNKRLTGWLRAAGLPGDSFTPHALRHSFVTNLLDAGVPLHVVASLANHSSPTITMRYAKVAGGVLASLPG